MLSRRMLILVIASLVTTSTAEAQRGTRRCPPDCSPAYGSPNFQSGVRITYGGRVYLSLPNYDVALTGTPGLPGQPADDRARVIFRNGEGMYWDGDRFFVHPDYHYELVTRQYYSQHFISEQPGQWPPTGEMVTVEPSAPERPAESSRGGTIAATPDRSPVPLPNLPPMPYPPEKNSDIIGDPKALFKLPLVIPAREQPVPYQSEQVWRNPVRRYPLLRPWRR